MRRIVPALIFLLLFGMLLPAQESQKDKKTFRLPKGHVIEVYENTDTETRRLIYIDDTGRVTPIHPDLNRWIIAKMTTIRVLYPGDSLVWASNIDAQGEEYSDNVTILRAANNKTGRMVVLDTCADENDFTIIDLSPDGRRILYKIHYETHCILKVTDWSGNKTEFPSYREFDTYNKVFWLNNEEILVQEDDGLLVWNLRLDTAKPLLEHRNLGYLHDCSSKGEIIFTIESGGMSGILETATGQIEFLPVSCDGEYRWSPDGNTIYLFTRTEDDTQTISLIDRSTGEPQLLYTWSLYFYNLDFIKNGTALLLLEDDFQKYNDLFPIWFLDLKTGKWTDYSKTIGFSWVGPKACPHLYYPEGSGWILDSEVLGHCGRKSLEGIDRKSVPRERITDGVLTIRITENLYETTCLDSVTLLAGDKRIIPIEAPAELTATDQTYLTLKRGEFIELRFPVPSEEKSKLILEFTGFYEPGP